MIDFITNRDQYKNHKEKVDSFFTTKPFEENPFHKRFRSFLGFEFDYIFHESFFHGLKTFTKEIGNKSIVFYTIKPSPVEYFYPYFKKYNIFEASITATNSELEDIFTKDPGDSPADSLSINSNYICWFSESEDWTILCSRDWELGIVGFTNLETQNIFIHSFNRDSQTMFTTIKKQIMVLKKIKYIDQTEEASYNLLLKNYNRVN